MTQTRTFTVVGGDMRQTILASLLQQRGQTVRVLGLSGETPAGCISCSGLLNAVHAADCLVLPLPCSCDGMFINIPSGELKLSYSNLLEAMRPGQLLFGGKPDESLVKLALEKHIDIFDYFSREELAVHNAVPTAEGAIQLAMEELPITISGSHCVVLGYGRIGKLLSQMLRDLHAHVQVAARSQRDLAWIRTLGMEPIKYTDLSKALAKADAVFNTVPSQVLGSEELRTLKRDALVIDLASRPGGVDFAAANLLGVKVIWALSLPGKVAPLTAAEIICDTILNMIEEVRG